MARNRLSTGILGRKSGGSLLARGAYNHRDQYRDARTGKLTDDNRPDRADLEWNALFAKDINNVPEWWSESRERIFNELEKREDRSTRPNDAQIAYDFKISLPHELNSEQRRGLITEWALRQTSRGYVVDVAIHRPNPTENDPRNYHAHILMPMRPINRDGWGNKFRAPVDSRRDFEKWAEQNLKDWREQLSELGAAYLERAGFHEEAERFRVGHLSRPERAKAAHDRGDSEEFERLLDEPQRYMGPAATAMERNNKRTRTGDINREVEERNKLRGPTRDIRFAYALADGDQQKFLDALAEKDMMVARISKQEDRAQVTQFAREYRDYVPQYREHEHVVVTEKGEVYRLTPSTTGENWKKIREFSKPLYEAKCLGLTETLVEQQRRSLIPKLDRNAAIEQMIQPTPPAPRLPDDAISRWLEENLGPVEARFQPGLSSAELKSDSRTPVPGGAKHLNIRGPSGEQLWWAYNSSSDPEKFHESLKERGLHLARVTPDDARDSHTQYWAAKRQGGYHPILREGEYVAVSEEGGAFRLGDQSVGHSFREVKAFMSKLDAKPMPTLREVENAVHEKRMKEMDASPRDIEPTNRRLGFGPVLGRVRRGTERAMAQAFDRAAGGFESLFAPKITPEERRLAEVQEHEQQLAADRAERQRSGGRDR
jgi:hypothetical protein